MPQHLRAYEMVEGTTPDEIALMKQQRRIEEAQRLRRQKQAAQTAAVTQPRQPSNRAQATQHP